jgi:hypothetical protein
MMIIKPILYISVIAMAGTGQPELDAVNETYPGLDTSEVD